jgi:hypothetical protein
MPVRRPLRVEVLARPTAGARTLAARIRALAGGRAAARSAEAAVAGAVVVAILPAVLPKLVELLGSWMALRTGRSVKVKVSRGDAAIEVEFAPGERGAEEILEFVARLERRLGTSKRKGRAKDPARAAGRR